MVRQNGRINHFRTATKNPGCNENAFVEIVFQIFVGKQGNSANDSWSQTQTPFFHETGVKEH